MPQSNSNTNNNRSNSSSSSINESHDSNNNNNNNNNSTMTPRRRASGQQGVGMNIDQLTILRPISRSSSRRSSAAASLSSSSFCSMKNLIFFTIVIAFVLAAAVVFHSGNNGQYQLRISWMKTTMNQKLDTLKLNTDQHNSHVVAKVRSQSPTQAQRINRHTKNSGVEEATIITTKKKMNDNEQEDDDEGLIVEGTIIVDANTKISYYHQAAAATSKATTVPHHDLVLLHGAAFTKEDWKKPTTKGMHILSLFHTEFPSISVTAVDLPVSADQYQLVALLEAMVASNLITSLPVAGLVTPSASGKTITDWICSNNENENNNDTVLLPLTKLSQYIHYWIPVASNSVKRCAQEQLQQVGALSVSSSSSVVEQQQQQQDNNSASSSSSFFEIFAIYGNLDTNGKKITEQKLVPYANAKSLELPGHHPVYLDSPLEFVQAIGTELTTQNQN